MSEVQEATYKKYVLIDAIKSSVKHYTKVSKESSDAILLNVPKRVPLHLQHTISDANGKQKVIRYKQSCETIFQPEQIKEFSIPANEKFTQEERDRMTFINGILIATEEIDNKFLSADFNPQREDFKGKRRGPVSPIFKELDEDALANDENEFLMQMMKAGSAIFSMKDISEVAALLAVFFGPTFKVPEKLRDAQTIAVKALEGDEKRIKIVNEWNVNADQEIVILLNKAFNKEVISFDAEENQVSLKKNDKWVPVKMIAADTYEQKEALFRQYLTTEQGELVKKEIEALVSDEKKEEKKKAK